MVPDSPAPVGDRIANFIARLRKQARETSIEFGQPELLCVFQGSAVHRVGFVETVRGRGLASHEPGAVAAEASAGSNVGKLRETSGPAAPFARVGRCRGRRGHCRVLCVVLFAAHYTYTIAREAGFYKGYFWKFGIFLVHWVGDDCKLFACSELRRMVG